MKILSMVASGAIVFIILLAFRSLSILMVFAVPVMAGVVVGTTSVWLVFGQVHAASITFGAALVGMAIDYPFHVAVQARANTDNKPTFHAIWPTLGLSVATTLITFAPIALSGFPGVAQLGVFATSGIAAAGITTRVIMPLVISSWGMSEPVRGWRHMANGLRKLAPARIPLVILAAFSLLLSVITGRDFLEQDMARLSPITKQDQEFDRKLRAELDAPDVRRMIVIEAGSREEVLQISERLLPELDRLVADRVLGGYDAAARYLPSRRSQAERFAALPDTEFIAGQLAKAVANLPFRANTFDGFISDLKAARRRGAIGLNDIAATPVGRRVSTQLFDTSDGSTGIITLRDVAAPIQLAHIATELGAGHAFYLDIKNEYDRIVAGQRDEAIKWVSLGLGIAVLVLFLILRRPIEVFRIGAPVLAALVLTTATLALIGEKVSIFHLLALLLVVGLSLDYSIFFNRMFDQSSSGLRTLKALVLCATTTIVVFGILAYSSVPILHGIGLTVSIGVGFGLMCVFILGSRKCNDET